MERILRLIGKSLDSSNSWRSVLIMVRFSSEIWLIDQFFSHVKPVIMHNNILLNRPKLLLNRIKFYDASTKVDNVWYLKINCRFLLCTPCLVSSEHVYSILNRIRVWCPNFMKKKTKQNCRCLLPENFLATRSHSLIVDTSHFAVCRMRYGRAYIVAAGCRPFNRLYTVAAMLA
jgi:hypothetical protein